MNNRDNQQPDRNVDIKDPVPAERIDDQSADKRSRNRSRTVDCRNEPEDNRARMQIFINVPENNVRNRPETAGTDSHEQPSTDKKQNIRRKSLKC